LGGSWWWCRRTRRLTFSLVSHAELVEAARFSVTAGHAVVAWCWARSGIRVLTFSFVSDTESVEAARSGICASHAVVTFLGALTSSIVSRAASVHTAWLKRPAGAAGGTRIERGRAGGWWLRSPCIEGVEHGAVGLLLLEVVVERKGIFVRSQPSVAVSESPSQDRFTDSLVLKAGCHNVFVNLRLLIQFFTAAVFTLNV